MSRTLAIFGIKLKKDLQAKLLAKEKEKAAKYGRSSNQNSRLWGSIKVVYDDPTDPATLTLVMNDYWYWVNNGRKPGDVSQSADINSWIRRKNINPVAVIEKMKSEAGIKSKKRITFNKALDQFSFLTRRKLKRVGYEANHFFDEIINDGRLEQLRIDLRNELQREIFINVSNAK